MASTDVKPKRESLGELIAKWREVINTCNLQATLHMDPVSKWLILTRACVFSMTVTSGLIGGLLAIGARNFNLLYFALAVIGLAVAHASNNLINDYFDEELGLDSSEDYARAQYAPHPLLSDMVTKAGMRNAILLLNVIDLAILVILTIARGPLTIAFALAGLFISFFYTAPPLRLKRLGLGELGVVLVWGPLMIDGTYYVTAGDIPNWVIAASLPYALLVGTVLIGKHVDKIDMDKPRGINTLPVILGEKVSLRLNQILFALFYLVVLALVATSTLSLWLLVVLISLPLLFETLKIYSDPKPSEPPDDYPVWPLWFVSFAFRFTRQAGVLFVLGLILHAIYPVYLSTFF